MRELSTNGHSKGSVPWFWIPYSLSLRRQQTQISTTAHPVVSFILAMTRPPFNPNHTFLSRASTVTHILLTTPSNHHTYRAPSSPPLPSQLTTPTYLLCSVVPISPLTPCILTDPRVLPHIASHFLCPAGDLLINPFSKSNKTKTNCFPPPFQTSKPDRRLVYSMLWSSMTRADSSEAEDPTKSTNLDERQNG